MAPAQPSYVRRALAEPEPPPVPSIGALAWTRARLFSGPFNTALTIVSALLIALGGTVLIPPADVPNPTPDAIILLPNRGIPRLRALPEMEVVAYSGNPNC